MYICKNMKESNKQNQPMENYIVSARKYRPSTFDTVVGQRALTTTLKMPLPTINWRTPTCSAVREG